MNTKRLTRLVALILCLVMSLAVLTACPPQTDNSTSTTTGGTVDPNGEYVWVDDGKNYTYNTYVTLSPSNWNELTYQDANDTEILGYIGSSFYGYDFDYDEAGEIIPGGFVMRYSAATALEDVTAEYAEAWGLPADGKGYAYKITLRDDLKWQNGDPIDAADFVYSMKEQLNPLFRNYRADNYYAGNVNLVGAKAYAKQGQSGWFAAHEPYSVYSTDLDSALIWTMGPAIEDDELTPEDESRPTSYLRSYFNGRYLYDTTGLESTAGFLAGNFGGEVATWVAMEGKTLAEIKADEAMNACYTALLGWWQSEPNEELHLFTTHYTFPEASWDDVGIVVGDNELELVVILEKAMSLLKEDGSLSYRAAYYFSSLPLVHEATYERCKIAPEEGSTLWTTNYNTSVDTTMSWGPYYLKDFQSGKQFILERNLNWYGYQLPENEGLYLTDRIYGETIASWNTAWLKFQAGELEGIGIDPSIAAEYKTSSRAFFTPDDFTGSLQLQSDKGQLKARESDGVNKTILSYAEFRKALSLGIDRTKYAQVCTTSSLKGIGLFNSMHYLDVENGLVYRETDEAKKILCEFYGVNPDDHASLDAAVDSITGYNLTLARQYVTEAYNKALEAGDIKATDKVVLSFGTAEETESFLRVYNFLTEAWKEMVVGTPLEGKLDFDYSAKYGKKWATDFMAGAYDICTGGWTGAAWDPGYLLVAYLDPGTAYSAAWDTSAEIVEFTMVGCGPNGEDITDEMSLYEWWECLNGVEGAAYDFSPNGLPEAKRAQLIAMLEKAVLEAGYTVPLTYSFGASLISYKIDYITYEYNTFMGYGGMKYMSYNFTDEEWEAEVAKHNGVIDYTK